MMVRVTHQLNDGAGHNLVKFYTSTNLGSTWTQLGTTITNTGTVTLNVPASTSVLYEIGAYATTNLFIGKIYKAEIWQNPEDFASKFRNFQGAVRAFDAAAGGNDVAAMNARFADLDGTCKACHDKYRGPEEH